MVDRESTDSDHQPLTITHEQLCHRVLDTPLSRLRVPFRFRFPLLRYH